MRYRAQGKQVFQDDRHFADAAGEIEAMMIVNALRALDERDVDTPRIGNVVRNAVMQRRCVGRREGDEDAYSCGRRVTAGARVGCADCGR
jgi:hypothetical protein